MIICCIFYCRKVQEKIENIINFYGFCVNIKWIFYVKKYTKSSKTIK
eukprot:UN11601